MDVRRYFLSVSAGPVVYALPFAVCLLVARLIFEDAPWKGLLWGGLIGGAVLSVLYWQRVLPDRIKTRVFCFMRVRGSVL